MTAAVAARHALPRRAPAGRAVTRLAVRQVRRGTLIVAAVSTGMSTLVAAQYQSTFSGELDQGALRALAQNPAIRVLFGTPVALDDPGGFTVWRTGTPVLVLAGVWIMLTAIRITRGEEEAGRWNLLLSGPIRAVDVVWRCLLAVAGAAVIISAGVGLGLMAAGTDVVGALTYTACILGVTLTFATAGSMAAQVMPSRTSAVGLAVGFLACALLGRMLSDGVASLAWTAWLSPFGLVARVAPYADNRVAPLLVLACFALVFGVAAAVAAGGRDIGTGLLTLSTRRRPRIWLLGSIKGFAARRALRPATAWVAGMATYLLIIGAVIASILDFFEENPRFAELAAAAGFAGLNSAEGFAAAIFSLMSIATGLYAATRLAAFVNDETARRWTMSFAAPLARTQLLGTEIAVTASGLVALHAVAAAAMWSGAALTGAPLSLSDALAGALNTAPIAWLSLGAAALGVGCLPSMVAAVGALPVVGGFLLNVIGESTHAPAWVMDLSPFVHVAAVPSVSPNLPATGALLAVGAALITIGLAGYRHRDLTS